MYNGFMSTIADVPTPTYITVALLKTRGRGLYDDTAEEDLAFLIQTAEDQIDNYVRPQRHHPDDDNTNRVFPRDIDSDDNGAPIIPYKVTQAAMAQVRHLFNQWYSVDQTAELPIHEEVQSFSISGNGGYSETKKKDKGPMDLSRASLCKEAITFLENMRNSMYSIADARPATVGLRLSSRDGIRQ